MNLAEKLAGHKFTVVSQAQKNDADVAAYGAKRLQAQLRTKRYEEIKAKREEIKAKRDASKFDTTLACKLEGFKVAA